MFYLANLFSYGRLLCESVACIVLVLAQPERKTLGSNRMSPLEVLERRSKALEIGNARRCNATEGVVCCLRLSLDAGMARVCGAIYFVLPLHPACHLALNAARSTSCPRR